MLVIGVSTSKEGKSLALDQHHIGGEGDIPEASGEAISLTIKKCNKENCNNHNINFLSNVSQ